MFLEFRGRRRRRLGSLLTVLVLLQAMLLAGAPAARAAAPTVSNVSPATIGFGYASPPTVTVTGTGFVQGATNVWVLTGGGANTGKASNVSVSSATQLTFTLGTGLGVGNYTVRVQTPDGSSDQANAIQVANPSISLSPAQVSAGYSNTTVTVTGTNTSFSGASVVEVLDGSGNNTNKVADGSVSVSGATALTFTLQSGLAAGTYSVRVTTGSQQVTADLTVVTPSVSLDVPAVNVGYDQTTITATGTNTNFSQSSQVVLLDGSNNNTNKVSAVNVSGATSLSFSLLTRLNAGDYTLRITTGGETVSTGFTVRTPSISVSPSTAVEGYTAFPVTVTGTNTDFSAGLTTVDLTRDTVSYSTYVQNTVVNSPTSVTFTLAAGLASGSYTLTATTNRTGGAQTASATVRIFGGRLVFTNSAPTMTVGESVYLTLELQDSNGQPLPAPSNLTVNLVSSSSGGGAFHATPGGSVITSTQIAQGTTTTSVYYSDTTAGTPTLTATISGYQPATQSATVNVGAANKLGITTTAQTITAGSRSGAITVELRDTYGNPVPAGTGGTTVGLSSDNSGGTFFTQASGGSAVTSVVVPEGAVSTSVYYQDTSAGTRTLTFQSSGLTPVTQAVYVNAASISQISPNAGSLLVAAGNRVAVAVTLKDAYGNTGATSAVRTVNLSSDSQTGAFYAAANGGSPIAALTLPQGTSSFTVYYADTVPGAVYLTLSRSGWTSGSVTVTVGNESPTVNPTVSISSPANGSYTNDATPTLAATASDNVAVDRVQIQYSGNGGGSWTSVGGSLYSAPYSATVGSDLLDGSYQVRALAWDTSGNQATSSVVTFTVDTVAPTITAQASPATLTGAGDITITVSSSETLAEAPTVTVTRTGGTPQSVSMRVYDTNVWTGTFTASSSSANGTYSISASGSDPAGNSGTGSGSFTVNLPAPSGGGTPPVEDKTPSADKEIDTSRDETVKDSGGTFEMAIPAGAIEAASGAKVKVSITQIAAAQVEELLKAAKVPEGVTSIGKAFEFKAEVTVDGKTQAVTTFAKPVTFTVNLSADDLKKAGDPEKIGVFRLNDDGTLTFVGGKYANGKLVIQLRGFSRYVLAEVKVAFNDMTDHWAKADVELMGSKYVVKGLPGGGFNPSGSVTRAEFAAMLVRAMGLPAARTALDFKDVKADGWYYGELMTAVNAGIIKGFTDGTFRPDAPVTREQVAAMVARALTAGGKAATLGEAAVERALFSFSDAGSVSAWAKDSMALAVNESIVRGRTATSLSPADGANRAEAAVMIARYWKK